MMNFNSLQDINTFSRIWFISGAVTVVLPLILFGWARLSYSGDGNDDNGNQDDDNNQNNQNDGAPWWWFGGNDERREEAASPALVFTYVWSLLLFGAILYYGLKSIRRGGQDMIVITSLIFFANLAFLMMILLQGVEGMVEADGPEMEENGFCGQMGVLMFITYFLWFIFSLLFVCLIRRRTSDSHITVIEFGPTDYTVMNSEPEVKVSNKTPVEI
jgi:hypothetical protein